MTFGIRKNKYATSLIINSDDWYAEYIEELNSYVLIINNIMFDIDEFSFNLICDLSEFSSNINCIEIDMENNQLYFWY